MLQFWSGLEAFDQFKDLQDGFFASLSESEFEYVACPFGHTECHPLFSKGSMRVVRCECGFVYNRRQAKQSALVKFYETSDAANKWVEIKSGRGEVFRQQSKYYQAVQHLKSVGVKSIADIGCGNGEFLRAMKGAGTEIIHGFEMNEKAAAQARDGGAWVQGGDLEYFIKNVSKNYDAISLWGVLEHLKDPLNAIKQLSQNLTAEGRLVICVPNVNSLLVRTLWPQAFTFCPQHLWYFSAASLSIMLQLCGFKTEHMYTIETESIPVLKHMYGFDPYQPMPAWANRMYLKQDWLDLMDRKIINDDDGYKIVLIGRKNAHSDNSSKSGKQKHKKQKSSEDWPKLVS